MVCFFGEVWVMVGILIKMIDCYLEFGVNQVCDSVVFVFEISQVSSIKLGYIIVLNSL